MQQSWPNAIGANPLSAQWMAMFAAMAGIASSLALKARQKKTHPGNAGFAGAARVTIAGNAALAFACRLKPAVMSPHLGAFWRIERCDGRAIAPARPRCASTHHNDDLMRHAIGQFGSSSNPLWQLLRRQRPGIFVRALHSRQHCRE